MEIPEPVNRTIAAVEALAKRPLRRREEMALLVTLAFVHDQGQALDDLSFDAKFAQKTKGILNRIGPDGNGYEQLAAELAASVGRIRALLSKLLQLTDQARRTRFESNLLAMTPAALVNFFALVEDLAWYKNYRLDSQRHEL